MNKGKELTKVWKGNIVKQGKWNLEKIGKYSYELYLFFNGLKWYDKFSIANVN